MSSDFLSLSQLGGSLCKHRQSWLPSEIWLEKATTTVMPTKIHNSERLLCLLISSHGFFVLLVCLCLLINITSSQQAPSPCILQLRSNATVTPWLYKKIIPESVFLRGIPNLPLSWCWMTANCSVSLLPGIGGGAGIWVKCCLEISVTSRDPAVECYPGNYFNWR